MNFRDFKSFALVTFIFHQKFTENSWHYLSFCLIVFDFSTPFEFSRYGNGSLGKIYSNYWTFWSDKIQIKSLVQARQRKTEEKREKRKKVGRERLNLYLLMCSTYVNSYAGNLRKHNRWWRFFRNVSIKFLIFKVPSHRIQSSLDKQTIDAANEIK